MMMRELTPEVTAAMSDDDNWEVYIPQIGERYAEGGQWRHKPCGMWEHQPAAGVICPDNNIYEYRRPKQKQKAEEPVSEQTAQPTKYASRVTQMTVARRGEPMFDESAVTITIEDEGAGEFVILKHAATGDSIGIDPKEWPALREAINTMIQNCRG